MTDTQQRDAAFGAYVSRAVSRFHSPDKAGHPVTEHEANAFFAGWYAAEQHYQHKENA